MLCGLPKCVVCIPVPVTRTLTQIRVTRLISELGLSKPAQGLSGEAVDNNIRVYGIPTKYAQRENLRPNLEMLQIGRVIKILLMTPFLLVRRRDLQVRSCSRN